MSLAQASFLGYTLFIEERTMNKHGQSIIEYSLIAVLVVLGVVTMGPYVLRSVGSHFKIWDDGIKDSFEENLTQAPVNDIPVINIPCTCKTTDNGCGTALVGSQCQDPTNPIKHGWTTTCTPIGCNNDPYSWCTIDPQCCTTPTNYGCGSVPLPLDGSGKVNTSLEIPLPNPANPPPANPANNNCYYGDEIQTSQCGTNKTYQCIDGSKYGCILPTCQGNPATGSLFCATNTNQPPNGLNNNYPVGTPLANQAACPQSPTCQIYCDTASGYTITGDGTGCAKQCPAASLPSSVIISSDANPSPMTAPPAGQNYYFLNFNTAGNGVFTETVTSTSGVVTPGQVYHLKMVSGRDGYGSQYNDNNCNSNNICDSDIVENDAGLLHIVVGDQQFGGRSNYDWQILDAKNNVVFEWSGLMDYSMDVAFTPVSCAPTAASCSFPGHTWTGYYSNVNVDNNDINNSYGNLYIIMSCTASSNLNGICIKYDSRQADAQAYRGMDTLASCATSASSIIACGAWLNSGPTTWNGSGLYWQNNSKNSSNNNSPAGSFSMACTSGQLANIIVTNPDPETPAPTTLTPAALNGCNWNGMIILKDFGDGNDVDITCAADSSGKGVITKFDLYEPI